MSFPFQLRWFFGVPALNFPGGFPSWGSQRIPPWDMENHHGWEVDWILQLQPFIHVQVFFDWIITTNSCRLYVVEPCHSWEKMVPVDWFLSWNELKTPYLCQSTCFCFIFSHQVVNVFWWGESSLRDHLWMPPAACQIRRCLGTLPAQPREVRFFRLELGADRRFFFRKD